MKVIGIGDNVCDKYVHLKTMFPGGQALNFAVYAKMLGADASALPYALLLWLIPLCYLFTKKRYYSAE